MKYQDVKLTLQETEQLCSLYMDCRLSVLEEIELKYVLSQVDYHSPLIDEVRQLMNIDTYISDKPLSFEGSSIKIKFRKWKVNMSIVASIAIIIGIGVFHWESFSNDAIENKSVYIAYVNGKQLSENEAKHRIEASEKAADDFIQKMSDLEAEQQKMIDNFLINNTPEL
ncbi:MAG: hypothetical protein K2M56_02050 [Muribaculaceae bacterium]|nr:hypothetical protein [Muribaculaceae bacterium]